MESTIAAARLIFGGVTTRHPSLRFGFVHGGGFSPYQVGRWDHGWSVRDEPKRHLADVPPSRHYGSLYFDSPTHNAISLRLLGARVGWDHVLWEATTPSTWRRPTGWALSRPPAPRSGDTPRVLGENAVRFLRPMAPG